LCNRVNHITRLLSDEQVFASYEEVAKLYPHIPSLSLWRTWEHAAYQGYLLPEPVLDVGCGDGRWFQFVWPQIEAVYGLDIAPGVAETARLSGVYREVYVSPADRVSVEANSFASVFANCSLEHMDNLDAVLNNIYRFLRVGGVFLFSVVTDKFLEWATLPLLAGLMGYGEVADQIQANFLSCHHLVSALSVEEWCNALEEAGFEVLEYTAIVPEMTSRLFLFLDTLWHLKTETGEVGDLLYPYLQTLPNFPAAFGGILEHILQMETDLSVGSGAVLLARKVKP